MMFSMAIISPRATWYSFIYVSDNKVYWLIKSNFNKIKVIERNHTWPVYVLYVSICEKLITWNPLQRHSTRTITNCIMISNHKVRCFTCWGIVSCSLIDIEYIYKWSLFWYNYHELVEWKCTEIHCKRSSRNLGN
jgi:hypothetical protein